MFIYLIVSHITIKNRITKDESSINDPSYLVWMSFDSSSTSIEMVDASSLLDSAL